MKENSKDSEINKNYNLKSDAVEALANADTEEAPEYSQEELNQYRTRKGFKLSDTVKILLIKGWFAGAVCFFFLWGLGTYIGSMLDMLFVMGVALGIVTDLLTNNVIRFIEKTVGANDRWIMFAKKGMMSFFLNIIYSFVIVICVYWLYNVINGTIASVTGNPDMVALGVEPFLFGAFCMGFDVLFVTIKQMIKKLLGRA